MLRGPKVYITGLADESHARLWAMLQELGVTRVSERKPAVAFMGDVPSNPANHRQVLVLAQPPSDSIAISAATANGDGRLAATVVLSERDALLQLAYLLNKPWWTLLRIQWRLLWS